jgi:hypothetical protein
LLVFSQQTTITGKERKPQLPQSWGFFLKGLKTPRNFGLHSTRSHADQVSTPEFARRAIQYLEKAEQSTSGKEMVTTLVHQRKLLTQGRTCWAAVYPACGVNHPVPPKAGFE